jgi:RNA polymerase sigma-70 factor (ECF subfamily)
MPEGNRAREGVVDNGATSTNTCRLDDLMRRYAAGETTAFEHLYGELLPLLRRVCRRLSKRGTDTEDLLQDTFLRFHRYRASYVPGVTAVSWILSIARSAHLDSRRCARRSPVANSPDTGAGPRNEGEARVSSDPESELSVQACLAAVSQKIDGMSAKLRTAYLMFRQQGFSVAQIAERLKTTDDAVKQRVHRAEEQLRLVITRSDERPMTRRARDPRRHATKNVTKRLRARI